MTTKLTSKTQKAIQIIALKAKEDPNCKFTSTLTYRRFSKRVFQGAKEK